MAASITDLAVLRDQAEVFGPVASTPTAWQLLADVDERHWLLCARPEPRLGKSLGCRPRSTSPKNGLVALPRPDESVLLLIDHQPLRYLYSHNSPVVSRNALALAKAARACGVPTVLTTVVEGHNCQLLQPLQDLFADQQPINRHLINPWDDRRVTDAVKATGRTKLVIAGLHTAGFRFWWV